MRKNKIPSRLSGKLRNILHYRALSVFIVLVVLSIVFYMLSPKGRFFDPRAIRTILTRAPEYGIVAIGITFLMISQELDISVGSVFTFCSVVFASLYLKMGVNPLLTLLVTIAIGAIISCINGIVSLKFGIPSIITTLGMMYLWRGVALVTVAGKPLYYRGTAPFGRILNGTLFGFFPMGFIWFVVITILFEIILYYHRFGNRVRVTGGNTQAAREMGINTELIKIFCFVLVGLLTSFASILESTRIGEGSARLGVGYEFYSIAAVVIGGTSLFGGVGTATGSFLGAIILEMIRTGLALIGISGWYFNIFIGIVIIIAMIMNTSIMRRVKKQGKV